MEPRLLVVGGGIAGLSTAVHALSSGYEVDVYEHGERPGGVCTSWSNGPYTVDGCIHWLMGSSPGGQFRPLYEEIGAFDEAKLLPLTHFARVIDLEGRQLDFTADLAALPRQAALISPKDGPLFEELAEAAAALADFGQDVGEAPELRGYLDSIGAMWGMRRHLPRVMRYMQPMSEFARRVHDPFLRKALLDVCLTDMPVAFVLVTLGQLSAGQLNRIQGGSARFTQGIVRKIEALGGRIHYGADVDEILVDNEVATGVRLRDGSTRTGDRVISAAPGYPTIFEMLRGRYTDPEILDRYARWPTFNPVALVSFGVRRTWPDLPPVTHLVFDDPWMVAGHPVRSLLVRNMSDDPSLAPLGHTVLQAMFETPFAVWHDAHHEPERYRDMTARLADETLARVSSMMPGLRPTDVDMRDVVTPYTFWRFARTWRGAFEGWLPTVESVRRHVKKTLPGLSGFYMAGQWVEPGGGVPTAVMSGRHVVQLLCHDDGRPFRGSPPSAWPSRTRGPLVAES